MGVSRSDPDSLKAIKEVLDQPKSNVGKQKDFSKT
jgi:hypothetical protein